jgi:hypothetical protein
MWESRKLPFFIERASFPTGSKALFVLLLGFYSEARLSLLLSPSTSLYLLLL